LRENNNGILSLKDTLCIGIQVIQILENLHNQGIIHRDMKPENILMENQTINKLYLIDFGLSRYYIDQERNHIPIQYGKKMIGNIRFASLNIHNGIEPSRRDDLISLGYILIFCLKGSLPWQKIDSKTKEERNDIIKTIKQTTSFIDLCSDIPYEFLSYMSYCYSLGFDENPNYNYIKNLFSNLILIV